MNESEINTAVTFFERSTEGDGKAMNSLLEHYLPHLHAFVHVQMGDRLRDREDSLDVVQSVCRELIEHRDEFQFRGESQFRSWLFTAALNKIRAKARFHGRARRDVNREVRLDGGSRLITSGLESLCSPSADVIAREEVERVMAALERLDEDHRKVVSLIRIAGLTSTQAGEVMGRNPAAVRKLLGRALLKLSKECGPISE